MPQSAIHRPPEGVPPAREILVSALKAMVQLEEDEEKTNALLQFNEALLYGLRIEFQLNNVILNGISERNFLLVHFDFPGVYLKEIEKLLWFNWRAACFTITITQPYGVPMETSSKGVCLIFESAQIDGSRIQRSKWAI